MHQYTETDMTRMAQALRELADQIEKSNIPRCHLITWHHLRDVHGPALGETLVDAIYLGSSFLITTVSLSNSVQTAIENILQQASGGPAWASDSR